MNAYRQLPSVDALSSDPRLAEFPRTVRTRAARAAVDVARRKIDEGNTPDPADIVQWAVVEATNLNLPSLRKVINASGVILHTGLGRARLAPSVVEHITRVASGHSGLEWDMAEGQRGDRQLHVEELLCELTGAERALVVNNAAGALVLVLAALSQGKEVVLSRGQMVEIGGSFRVPEIVEQSGCFLTEVGCTNRTRLSDFRDAINPETAVILRCSTSNFRMTGFVSQPSLQELSGLAKEHELVLVDDMGSGCLVDTRQFGLPRETTLGDSVRDGADVVIASGDKLLGGPQVGIVLSNHSALARIKSHPLARAMRADKLSLAALEATLRLYSSGREAEIPTLRYLSTPLPRIRTVARRLARAYNGLARSQESFTEVGSGSAPGTGLPTFCAVLMAESPTELARRLRSAPTPIVGRVKDGAVWLDPRTVDPDELVLIERTLRMIDPC